MKTIALTLAGCLYAMTAFAQALSSPRATVTFDDDVAWHQTYTADDGPLAGTPFLTEVRLTLAPVAGGSGARVISIPRAQVTLNGETLSATDVPVPLGNFTVTAQFVTGTGVMGVASTPIPFELSRPAPAAPRSLRLQVQPQ